MTADDAQRLRWAKDLMWDCATTDERDAWLHRGDQRRAELEAASSGEFMPDEQETDGRPKLRSVR